MNFISPDGRYNRAAIMRDAHRQFGLMLVIQLGAGAHHVRSARPRREAGGVTPLMGAKAMRLILVDNNSGYIFGDTANYLAGSSEWCDDNSGDDRDPERLSLLAARLLDESIGEPGRAYSFLGSNPHNTSTGYHIYRADVGGSEAVPIVWDGHDGAIINAVAANCHYVGFVRCG